MSARVGTALSSQRWRYLIPLVFVTYTWAYLDRSNYSIGVAGGLKESLQITGSTAGLLGGLFFLGYFIFQIPAAHYAEHHSVRRLMLVSLIGWGVFASAQGWIPWLWLLMVDRFLLGVVEAAVLPAMLIFLMHWFTSHERGRADTFLILGNPITLLWMSAVSGYLIQAVGWRWMFVIEGVPAIGWAVVFWVFARDHPSEAGWLNDEEKESISEALSREQRTLPQVATYLQAFRKPGVIVLAVQYFLWSIGVYGFVFWLPTILKAASHQRIGNTGAMSAAPYALAVILMVVSSHFSDRTGRRIVYVWPALLLGAITFYVSYRVSGSNVWLSWALLIIAAGCMYAPYGPYFALISELMTQNVSGAAIALVNSLGALGGFVGAYVVGGMVGSDQTPLAFIFMAACLAAAAVLMWAVRRPPSRQEQEAAGRSAA